MKKLISKHERGKPIVMAWFKYNVLPDIKSTGSKVVKGEYNGNITFNGRRPEEGYRYYDNGKDYQIVNGTPQEVTKSPIGEKKKFNTLTGFNNVDINYIIQNLKEAENNVKKGYRNGKWFPFDTNIKDDSGKSLIDVGYGLNVDSLPSNYRAKAYKEGLTDQEVEELMKAHIAKGIKALQNPKNGLSAFGIDETSIPSRYLEGLLDMRYQLGSLGNFPKLLREGIAKNNLKIIQEESYTKDGSGNRHTTRHDQRVKAYFHKNGGKCKLKLIKKKK